MKASTYYYANVDAGCVTLIKAIRGPSFTTINKSDGTSYLVLEYSSKNTKQKPF